MTNKTKLKLKHALFDFAVVLITFLLTTLLCYTFLTYQVRAEYLLLIYLLGTIIIVYETSNFFVAVCSSIIFLFAHTFLFVEPRYSLLIHSKSFLLIMVIFISVAIFVNILVVRLKKQMDQSKKEARLHKDLYQAIEGLLKMQDTDSVVEYSNKALRKLAHRSAKIFLDNPKENENEAIAWCFKNSSPCGHGEAEYPDEDNKYLPIRAERKTIGVVSLDCTLDDPDSATLDAVHALLNQVTLAMQRCRLEEIARKEASTYAREKIKSQVMKNLSHDMSPRANSIKTLSTELRNEEGLSTEEINSRLDVIVSEAEYLYDTIDNLLDITSK